MSVAELSVFCIRDDGMCVMFWRYYYSGRRLPGFLV